MSGQSMRAEGGVTRHIQKKTSRDITSVDVNQNARRNLKTKRGQPMLVHFETFENRKIAPPNMPFPKTIKPNKRAQAKLC